MLLAEGKAGEIGEQGLVAFNKGLRKNRQEKRDEED